MGGERGRVTACTHAAADAHPTGQLIEYGVPQVGKRAMHPVTPRADLHRRLPQQATGRPDITRPEGVTQGAESALGLGTEDTIAGEGIVVTRGAATAQPL